MKYYEKPDDELNLMRPSYRANKQEFGCEFCWDNRKKKDIEIFFFDRANNMRASNYCPSCGRQFNKED